MDIRRQVELWSPTEATVFPLRLADGQLSSSTAPGQTARLAGSEVMLRKSEPVVSVVIFAMFGALGLLCGGGAWFLNETLALVCAGLPVLVGIGLAIYGVVRKPHLTIEGPNGKLEWTVPTEADLKELDFFVDRLNARAKQDGGVLQEAVLAFQGRVPSRLSDKLVTAELYPEGEALPRVEDDEVNARLDKADLALNVSFATDDLMSISRWLSRHQGIILLGEQGFQAAVESLADSGMEARDPKGEQVEAFLTKVKRPEDSIRRRLATRMTMCKQGLGLPPVHLPSISEAELSLRSPALVADRAHALFLISMASQEFLHTGSITQLAEPLAAARALLSPAECAFVDAPGREAAQQLAFRIEGVNLLAWALGWTDAVPEQHRQWEPRSETDQRTMMQAKDHAPGESLRSPGEIADLLDRVYCCHWLVRDRAIRGEPRDDLAPGAVVEQHVALLWLTEEADWDDVSPHT